MMKLRPDLPAVPSRMRKLRIDARGYPVPFFVAWIDGQPDFRAIDTTSLARAVKYDLCWLCGEPLGRFRCFLVGPMCIVNRTTAEPPSHVSCAEFAAKACPFLTRPLAKRNVHDMPADAVDAPGIPLDRNPGVTAEWVVLKKGYKPFDDGTGRALFRMADPVEVRWWREARSATRDEALAGITSGLPSLASLCENSHERAELDKMLAAAQKYLPSAS